MDNSKCDCGAVKTYGSETAFHSDWCTAIKPPPPKEEIPSKWPWGSDWLMSDEIQKRVAEHFSKYVKELDLKDGLPNALNLLDNIKDKK